MNNDSKVEKKCFIWTRVSTKYQEDNGGSLDDQRCKCENYAKEHKFNIIDYFGGKHESAKTPGRLIREMIDAVKRNRSVSYILVSQADRFSRNAGQGISILNDLITNNIIVTEVSTGLDTSTPEGLMMMQVKVCMSQWDNTNRVNKFISGRKHCMEVGVYTGKSPEGYDKTGKSINTTYTINDKGILIRKAFKWKLQGMSNKDIISKLATYNYIVSKQTLHKILTNPFYAGKIVNKMMNKEVKDGKHPAIISYEEYLRVQDILSGKTGRYIHRKETPQFPLKRHVKCAEDGTPFTAYSVKKKNIDYYKCNKVGCRTNVSAKILHQKYAELLEVFTLPAPLKEVAKKIVYDRINGDSQDLKENLTLLKKNKSEIENKIKNNKLRFADGDIDEDVYKTALEVNQEKLNKTILEIDQVNKELSNSNSDIDAIVEMCCKLGCLWKESSLQVCQKLQNLVFPDGILWDKRKCSYRTIKTNKALELIAEISSNYKKVNEGIQPSSVALCGWGDSNPHSGRN